MNKKTVWLTGGGTGIGKDLTKLLCDNGFDVIISGRRKDKLIEVAKYNKKKIFPYYRFYCCDATKDYFGLISSFLSLFSIGL